MGSEAAVQAVIEQIKQTLQNLQAIYQPLTGVTFTGTYLGSDIMPQTENERYKIESNSLKVILQQISSSVINMYGETLVWKGITGPEDREWYTDYWLWIEPDVGGMPLVYNCSYSFNIESCTPFDCERGSFSYGVSIKASIVHA